MTPDQDIVDLNAALRRIWESCDDTQIMKEHAMSNRSDLIARLAALPEVALPTVENLLNEIEAAALPASGTQIIVAGATITARPDLVYQGEVTREGVSRR